MVTQVGKQMPTILIIEKILALGRLIEGRAKFGVFADEDPDMLLADVPDCEDQ
jgi:hypothetical protein